MPPYQPELRLPEQLSIGIICKTHERTKINWTQFDFEGSSKEKSEYWRAAQLIAFHSYTALLRNGFSHHVRSFHVGPVVTY